MKSFMWMTIVLAVLSSVTKPCFAQSGLYGGAGVVSGTGSVDIERMPEAMRMKVVITAKGPDLKAALAALKDRAEAARAQLAALGADKASVKTDEPQIATATSNQQRQMMEMMMAQRLRGGKKREPAKKDEKKQPVSVSTTLTAQWPVKAENAEDLLISASTLQEKIKAADVAGAKEASELSPDEQEALDELESSGYRSYGGEEEAKPGEPTFFFVSTVSDVERDKAMAQAFQKAKEKAARTAKAAGAELGKLHYVDGNNDPAIDPYEYAGGYPSAAYRMMQAMRQSGKEDLSSEAIGVQPGKVTYRVSVSASFELKSP